MTSSPSPPNRPSAPLVPVTLSTPVVPMNSREQSGARGLPVFVEAAQQFSGHAIGFVQRRIAPRGERSGKRARDTAASQILMETFEFARAAAHGQDVDRLACGGRVGGEVRGVLG